METFKILARSTKLKPSEPTRSGSTLIPSAGKARDPQLFRDEGTGQIEQAINAQSNGRKRKRDDTNLATSPAENLDYFSTSSPRIRLPQAAKPYDRDSEKNEKARESHSLVDGVGQGPKTPLSVDERKQILQAHKIKITDISRDELERGYSGRHATRETKKTKLKLKALPKKQSQKKVKKLRRIYPDPLLSFEQLRTRYSISRRLHQNLREQGFTIPTEVQLGSLPLLLREPGDFQGAQYGISDINLLSVAPTGSGKTLSFLVPLLNDIIAHARLVENKPLEKKKLSSLIVVPTKELAFQIVNEGRKLVKGTGLRITGMQKGLDVVGNQAEAILPDSQRDDHSEGEEAGPSGHHSLKSDVLVATPLSLLNALSANHSQDMQTLPSVRYLILDEADVLLDPLFRDQTLQLWDTCTNHNLRVSLWSATMGSNIEELAKSIIDKRYESLGISDQAPLLRLVVGLKDSAIPNISHRLVYAATEQGKLLGLRQLLHPSSRELGKDVHLRPPFLVFTQTIPRAIALHSELLYDIPAEAGGSTRIAVLHSDLSDNQRSDTMTRFRKGEVWVMITTDLLARGVDFRGINGIVNYDIPNSSAAYVHRVGRTGRAGREGGIAVTFYTKEDIPYVKNIANVIATSDQSQGKTGDSALQKWLLDALPNPSKKMKKDLKWKGVETRRAQPKEESRGSGNTKTRISTKSGFDRRLENKKKGSVKHSQAMKQDGPSEYPPDDGSDEWEGLGD